MGQYWRLVNIDSRVSMYLGKLGEGIWAVELQKYLLPGVLDPLRPLEEILNNPRDPLRSRHDQHQSPLLSILDNDVLRHIFDCLSCTDDTATGVAAACFALTCQLCFEAGYSVLQKHQEATHSWAGNRLIIAGDYQKPSDLPNGLQVDQSWCLPGETIYRASEYFFNRHYALNMLVFKFLLDSSRSMSNRNLATKWICMFDMKGRSEMACPTLRNLCKREYAREDVLKRSQEEGDHERQFKGLSIGDLAAFRICWSSDDSVSMLAPGISRGPWAGDRFDIVDFEHADLQGWKDVSEELVEEVAEIYAAEWGRAS
ncbi:hypothetical protein AURDEDRAFT_180473 [Auricularia subglabra TFB-10046 SS5]|nr:hypothetical protein AURDEDRAFT_180473 [Auricularia subglabra TFB-10046 SS5]